MKNFINTIPESVKILFIAFFAICLPFVLITIFLNKWFLLGSAVFLLAYISIKIEDKEKSRISRILKHFNKKYKNKEIFISELHYKYTYSGVFSLTKEGLPRYHKNFISETIPENIIRYFGTERIYTIVDLEKFDLSEGLPPVIVYAWFDCPSTEEDPVPGPNGKHLFLVWFQKEKEDPFIKAFEILKTINWEQEARDYDW